ncbi:MAG TPA: DEAD/DEAH box helicase, partial [Jiangellaceae bacterium]|nr:DEAD/DEAH box helicase [Jiangellaceae bacterium]
MTLTGLIDLFCTEPTIIETIGDARARRLPVLDVTAPAPMRPLIAAALSVDNARGGAGRPVLLVSSTYREAEDLTAALQSLLGEQAVAYYPAWETLPHERLSPRSDTVGRRLEVLGRLAGNSELPAPRIVVAPVRSVLQPQVKGLGNLKPIRLVIGEDIDLTDLATALVAAAYTRVDLVERRGEFAVRGGIVDIFPPTEEHPVRVDFFGDTVEEIHYFSVADQRSSDIPLTEIIASPCRELLLTEDVRARAAALADRHPELIEMLDKIAQGHPVDGMEALSPVLVDGMELLIELLPTETHVLICDPELVRGRAIELVKTSEEFLHASWAAAAGGGKAPIDLGASAYQPLAEVRAAALARGMAWWTLSPFSAGPLDQTVTDNGQSDPVRTADGEIIDLSAMVGGPGVESRTVLGQVGETYRGDTEAAVDEITKRVRDSWRVVVMAEGRGTADRIVEVLSEHAVPLRKLPALDDAPAIGVATVVTGQLSHGFVADEIRLAVFTATDLSGQRAADRASRKLPARRKNQIDPLELASGDPVVHSQHGVGRYVEMMQRTVAGATREYLLIEYAPSRRGQPGDRLYVPMDALDQVTRYVGGENPSLDRLGGADWAKRKGRARRAVREIAAELIKLYAARQATRGHAFSPDTTWQRELEDAFAFVETPDQLGAIDDVKRDMEQIVPMDRLICGDVGYGKTEIAVRAAFKAVQDGKQVAILVPTTLLVQQHYATFADRYAGFPVNVAPLSRFSSEAEARATIKGLAEGRVDVVVGTHRLLSEEVTFKDLGLVVIDEEQRFGVVHKEQLKRMRTHVDVLAMSATPIPRTLEMAITGIREMSTIATPPEERHPVLTFAGPYDEAQVVAAIRRELLREGQVFYVHNRVQSIDKASRRIAELVPEALVVTAHGQMSEQRLEQVMIDFWERRADVLVCTT